MDRAGHNPESANNGFHEYTLRFLSSIRCLIGQPNFSIKEERNPYTGIRTETPRTELIFAYTPFRDAKLTGRRRLPEALVPGIEHCGGLRHNRSHRLENWEIPR